MMLTPEMHALRTLICGLLGCDHHQPGPTPPLQPRWRIGGRDFAVSFTGDFTMNMKDTSAPLSVSVSWRDAAGKVALVQAGSLQVTSDNPNAIQVTGDAASGFKVGPGPMDGIDADPETGIIATVTLTATADADLGEGVTPVTAAGALVLVAGDANTGEITFTPAS